MQKKKHNLQNLVNGAWNFAYSLLWNNQTFNDAEIELAKAMIADRFTSHETKFNTFIEYCERVLLSQQYIARDKNRFAPHPLKYLNPFYKFGYEGTKEWYLDLVHERQYIPIHRFENRIMAEGYLRYLLSPTKENYLLAKNGILHYNNASLLQAFNNTIVNLQFLHYES